MKSQKPLTLTNDIANKVVLAALAHVTRSLEKHEVKNYNEFYEPTMRDLTLAVEDYMEAIGQKRRLPKPILKGASTEECPDCNNFAVIRQSGCRVCQQCGWEKCN